jgi:hypothetical protein
MKKKLVALYVQIYGTPNVMNNKFMFWVVKGYIAKVKGFEIKRYRVVACIARNKVLRESIERI